MGIYKSSRYNIDVDKLSSDKYLIFNTYRGSYVLLNEVYKNTLDNINNISEKNKVVEDLISQGLVIENEVDELNSIVIGEYLAKFRSDSLILTVAPSMSCNMSCPYCYEKDKQGVMDLETEEKLFRWVEASLGKHIKRFSLSWYGGEPLIKIDTIERLSEKFIKLCDEKEISYDSAIVTNGVLLTRENAEILKKSKVYSAQITIDGIGEEHNKRRKLNSGEDSFSIITQNIIDCHDVISISIRCNIDKDNKNQIEKIIEYLLVEKNLKNKVGLYFAPVTNIETSCIYDDGCYSFKEFSEIENHCSKLLYKKTDNMRYLNYPSPTPIACAATCMNCLVIDEKGNFYKCWNHIKVKDKIIGSIDHGVTLNAENYKWLKYCASEEEKCKSCEYLPVCMGGCPDYPLKGSGNQCNHKVYSYKNYLKIYYENYLRQKNKEEIVAPKEVIEEVEALEV